MRGYAVIWKRKNGSMWTMHMGMSLRLAEDYAAALRKSRPHHKFIVVEYREIRGGSHD